jgi:hypothetical protein
VRRWARWFFDDRQGTLTFSEPTRGKLIADARETRAASRAPLSYVCHAHWNVLDLVE